MITNIYKDDPLECTFGLSNPNYIVKKEDFCAQLVTTEFIEEVKQEIEDDKNSGSGTSIDELEAVLYIYD